jgi:phospholipid transport system substrate-binding protein
MSQYFKRSLGFSLAAALALSSQLAQAQPYGGYPGWGGGAPTDDYGSRTAPWSPRAEQDSPASLLQEGVENLTQFLGGKPNRGALAAYLYQEVAPWFDFDYMAAWAAGRRFQQMDDAQQAELTARIRESFLEKMAQKLARYSQQRAMFLPAQPDGRGQITLPMAIENPGGGYPARLEFRLRQTDKGWRVIDVSANGMSALLHYRQMFNEMMRQPRPQMMAPPMRPY